jgi:hypothetical protein
MIVSYTHMLAWFGFKRIKHLAWILRPGALITSIIPMEVLPHVKMRIDESQKPKHLISHVT